MNSSTLSNGHRAQYEGFSSPRITDYTLEEFAFIAISFLLASTCAALTRSTHALWYGFLYTSSKYWQRSVVLSLTVPAICYVLTLAGQQLLGHFNSAPEKLDRASKPLRTPQEDLCHGQIIRTHSDEEGTPVETKARDLTFFKPLLFPSRTTHRRLYPQTHAFSYSYLLVGVPIQDYPTSADSMISLHPSPASRRSNNISWFSVHATDYLQRGPSYQHLTLRAKLNLYLQSQDIQNPQETYPYAYLITAPRFLGFSFNPVSFWYLYDVNEQLIAMILEVNNTFDERRMYFLRADEDGTKGTVKTSEYGKDEDHSIQTAKRFTSKWKKDFHVSPFNDRDGGYSVSAVDILRTGRVDVTIVLSGDQTNNIDKDANSTTPNPTTPDQLHPASTKLIARVFSASAQDPTSLSLVAKAHFLLRHGYTGFLTNPRILMEARKLWWRKGLRVFYRPEPFDTTIPRVETAEEVVVEAVFRRCLDDVARRQGVEIEYLSAAGKQRGVMVRFGSGSPDIDKEGARGKILKIHVLTPAFYGELAMVNDINGGLQGLFERLCFKAEEKARMVDCSSAEVLRIVFAGCATSLKGSRKDAVTREKCGGITSFRRVILQQTVMHLRLSSSEGLTAFLRSPCRTSRSTFDSHVRMISSPGQYLAYLHATLIILLAKKLALGSIALLRWALRLLRIPLVFILAGMLMKGVSHLCYIRHGPATAMV